MVVSVPPLGPDQAVRATPSRPEREERMNQKRFWFLNRVKLFKGFSLEDAERIENLSEMVKVKRRHVIFMPGDTSDKIYLLKSGLVKISRVTEDGKELTLFFLSPGDVFGETALVDKSPRNTLAQAYEDCVLQVIERESALRFLISHQDFLFSLTQLISDRRRRLENKIDNLLFKGAHARLAGLFLELADEFGVRDSRGIIINLKLTHREIANLIGSTRETVSFALLDMRKDELIQNDGKRVVLLDLPRLEQLYEKR